MNRSTILPAALLLSLLAGCASPEMRRTDAKIAAEEIRAKLDYDKMQTMPSPYFRIVDEMWVGSRQVKQEGPKLPPILNTPVEYSHNYPVTLNMLAEHLSTNYGLSVTVTEDALESASNAAYDPALALVSRDRAQGGSQAQPQAGSQQGQSTSTAPGAGAFLLQYEGTIKGLLDQATARTGNSWKIVSGERVVIFGVDTRTYALHVVPGTSALTSTISNTATAGGQAGGGGGGGGGGGQTQSATTTSSSGQTTQVTTQIELIKSSSDAIKSMLTKRGKLAISEGAATITVTDVPAVLDRAQDYVDQVNDRMTRQVVIDVNLYSVVLNRQENYGLDWNLVWQNVGGRYQVTSSASPEVNPNAASLALSVIDPTYTFGGSKVMFNALSQQGNVSVKTSLPVVTLSNQPVPYQIAQQTSYIASIQTNLVANAGAQTTVTPGQITTGFTMNVLPIVLDSSEILLQVQLNLSTLDNLRSVTNSGQTIELPDVNSRQLMQKVRIHSGSTLVMSGFDQTENNTDGRGIGSPKFSLLGGSQTSQAKHTVLVVTITPRVVE
jgi:type IVB pilus formation R64 PilN family outer membrane protein